MAARGERLAENQRTFREANERLQELAAADETTLVPFICECADLGCLGRVEATMGEFELVHESRDRFFLVPGHPRLDGETVLSRNDRYEVVSKQDAGSSA